MLKNTPKPLVLPPITADVKERQKAYAAVNRLKYDSVCVKVRDLICKANIK